MAKDDYHVIVYKILAYLYSQLKSGQSVDPQMVEHDGKLFKINYSYWQYIIQNMYKSGYIDGVRIFPEENGLVVSDAEELMITPKGIEYISDDEMLIKVKNYLSGKTNIPTSI